VGIGIYTLVTSADNTIRQGYMASTGHSLIFIAKEKGFFEEEGLDVQLYEFSTGPEGLTALIADKIDVQSGGVAQPLEFINKEKDLQVIGGMMSGGSAAIAKNQQLADSLRNDPKKYEGLTVAAVKMSTSDVAIKSALKEQGMDLTKINFAYFRTAADVVKAVKTGKADADLVWPPFQYTAQQQGLAIVKHSNEYLPNHPCCRVITTSAKLNENPDKWVKYERALIKAYNFYKNDPDGTTAVVGKYVKMDPAVLKQALYDGHLSLSPVPNKKGTIEFWKHVEAIGYSKLDPNVDLSKHIGTSIYKKALDQLSSQFPNNANYQFLQQEYPR